MQVKSSKPGQPTAPNVEPSLDDLVAGEEFPNCECPDCMSAVSPLAYLTDLLDFSSRIICDSNDNKLTISDFEERLRQPFSTLPAECSQVSQSELYARLATEILLRYFRVNLNSSNLDPELKKVENNYRLHAYKECSCV